MKYKYFILSGFFFITILFSIYCIMFFFQLGAPIKAEWWIKNSFQYKDFKARSIKSKKIIIISGSNSLFGINSELIEKSTGYPVVNLAVHAALDINFLYYSIKEYIQEGDIVIVPLEFRYYDRTDKITNWFSNNIIGWGIDYLNQLSLIDLANFIIITEPNRVIEGVVNQTKANGKNDKLLSQEIIIKQLNDLWSKEGPKWRGYSYKSLNKFGDINVDKTITYKEDEAYLSKNMHLSSHFIDTYGKINKLIKQFSGTLYLTYPVTIRNIKFDLSKKESQERITNLENLLEKQEIKIKCNAALFNLDRVFFFNTRYHPNKYGALVRSDNLAYCLNKLIKDKNAQKLSYKQAINRTNALQKKILTKEIPNLKTPDS